MNDGKVQMDGCKDDILPKLSQTQICSRLQGDKYE